MNYNYVTRGWKETRARTQFTSRFFKIYLYAYRIARAYFRCEVSRSGSIARARANAKQLVSFPRCEFLECDKFRGSLGE